VEPRTPGAGAPGVAVRASTPVRHSGPRVRKKHIRSARVPAIEISTRERLPRTNAAALVLPIEAVALGLASLSRGPFFF